MSEQKEQTLAARNIPGMMNRDQRFAQVEHAENAGAALRRIAAYFGREKAMVLANTACGGFRHGVRGLRPQPAKRCH